MEFNGVPIVTKFEAPNDSKILEPVMYQNDLLIPIFDLFGKGVYFRIPGKLIKDIVDANTPHVNKVKR
jgi:hypothetical protein